MTEPRLRDWLTEHFGMKAALRMLIYLHDHGIFAEDVTGKSVGKMGASLQLADGRLISVVARPKSYVLARA